jgi:hypothetical protein
MLSYGNSAIMNRIFLMLFSSTPVTISDLMSAQQMGQRVQDLQRKARDFYIKIFSYRNHGVGGINETHAGKVDTVFIRLWND